MITKNSLPPALVAAEQIWSDAAKARNYVVVFSQHGYFKRDIKAAADLLVKAQIMTPMRENRVLGMIHYSSSYILTAHIQNDYRVAKDAPLEVLAPKVREALLKHTGE